MMKTSFCAALFLFTSTFLTEAAEFTFDFCRSPENWRISLGKDKTGVAGSNLQIADGGLKLEYDFSKGSYLALSPKNFPREAENFTLELLPEHDVRVTYRIMDRSGRTFQAPFLYLTGGKNTILRFRDSIRFQRIWGGTKETQQPVRPFRGIALIVNKDNALRKCGNILLKNFKGELGRESDRSVIANPFEQNACFWNLKGQWFFSHEQSFLLLECSPLAEENAALEITMPMLAKDCTRRIFLDAGLGRQTVFFPLPLVNGVNPRNIYRLKFRISSAKGTFLFSEPFSGRLSGKVNLGAAKDSREIASSKLGVNTHFIYPQYQSRKVREILFRELSQCGFKWIRDGILVDKDSNGKAKQVRASDLAFLQMARENRIQPLLIIPMSADESLEDFLQRVEIIIRDTKPYTRTYELGNEPNNFGNWRKRYSGPWNGWDKNEPDEISEWVKVHIKYTNAAADRIKELYPEATVIGLGSPSCTNFRAMMLPVSANLNGVCDHPYPWNMLPEQIPFSWALQKRDGIRIGDQAGTLVGLYQSYADLFRKQQAGRSLWITEFGWSTMWLNRKNLDRAAIYPGFSEEAQAEYLLRRCMEGLATPVVAHLSLYEFIDSGKEDSCNRQRNFGLLRHDWSRKPSYYVLSRVNALLHNAELDSEADVKLTVFSGRKKNSMARIHDGAEFHELDGFRLDPYLDRSNSNERMLGIWSMGPCSGENNNRIVGFKIRGWKDFSASPVAINMLTGETYDLNPKIENGEIIVEELSVKAPLLIKFFRK